MSRNYQLDVIKMVSAIMVFLCHTQWWADSNAWLITPQWLDGLGIIMVRVFFIISGLLMANSILRTDMDRDFGKNAVLFVVKKFKRIAWPVWVSILINLLIVLWKNQIGAGESLVRCIKTIPELFMLSMAGFVDACNSPLWFLSAQLICMLPYAYLLYTKKDLTLYILSPLTAIFTSGFIFQASGGRIDIGGFNGIFMNELIRTMCGLSLGVCAYTIYKCVDRKKTNILYTMVEVLIYLTFAYVVVFARESYAVMAVFFILPIAFAITFSGKSYICHLFQHRWMKYCGPLSLHIYINHWAAVQIVFWKFPGYDWGFSVFLTALLTICICGTNLSLVYLGQILWNRRLKTMLCAED